MGYVHRILVLASILTAGAWNPQNDSSGPNRSTADAVYTEAQAQRGEKAYADACLRCHPPKQFVGRYIDNWAGNTAGALYESIASTMPEQRPGNLKPREYADILAYIFRLNKLPAGVDELTGDLESLQKIVIERRKK